MKGLSQPFLVLTYAETDADDKHFRIHERDRLRRAPGYHEQITLHQTIDGGVIKKFGYNEHPGFFCIFFTLCKRDSM